MVFPYGKQEIIILRKMLKKKPYLIFLEGTHFKPNGKQYN